MRSTARLPALVGAATLVGASAARLATLPEALRRARERLASYRPTTLDLPGGPVTFVDRGEGPALLVLHGLFGGYDQGADSAQGLGEGIRVLAPSRCGYPGTPVREDGNPSAQVQMLIELLDELGIDEVVPVGTSAGGTIALRFALDHPERTAGVVLLSSAMPLPAPVADPPGRMGPPSWYFNDPTVWLSAPFLGPMMGMEQEIVDTMLPVAERAAGVEIDVSLINPDMRRRFDAYPVERIGAPVLIVHARDDKLAPFKDVKASWHRYRNLTTKVFDSGGHMIRGHGTEVSTVIRDFVLACHAHL